MSATLVQELNEQTKKYWSPLSRDELKERSVAVNIFNREYEGEIKQGGDSVKINQWVLGEANQKTVGEGHESFETNKLDANQITLVADKVWTHAFEFDDLVKIQTQLENPESELRMGMEAAVARKINRYLFSLMNPSSSNPDHDVTGVSDFTYDELLNVRMLATQAHWGDEQQRYMFLDPSYHKDFLSDTTVASGDYGAEDRPAISGKIGLKRAGFNIFEDDSQGLLSLDSANSATADVGLAVRPDALHLALGGFEYEISRLHSNKQFGFVMSLKVIGGAVRGHDHSSLCIKVRASS